MNKNPLPLTKRIPSQNSCIFSLCLFQSKDPLLPGTKPKPWVFLYVSAWNVLPMISTKAKLLNVLSISQSLTLPQLAITETIKKLIDRNSFSLIWKSTGKPIYCLGKRHYIFIIVYSSKWGRSYSLIFRSNQLVARNVTKYRKYSTACGGEKLTQILSWRPVQNRKACLKSKSEESIEGEPINFIHATTHCLFFFFFNERSYYWEKGKHQVDFEENKNSSINTSEMKRKGIPRTSCKSQTGLYCHMLKWLLSSCLCC